MSFIINNFTKNIEYITNILYIISINKSQQNNIDINCIFMTIHLFFY